MSNLSNLKVGDFVTVFDGGGWGPLGISKDEVVAISKAGNIKLKRSGKLWRPNGRARGGANYSRRWIDVFDQTVWNNIAADHKERRDRRKLEDTEFKDLSIETVRKLLAVLEENKPIQLMDNLSAPPAAS